MGISSFLYLFSRGWVIHYTRRGRAHVSSKTLWQRPLCNMWGVGRAMEREPSASVTHKMPRERHAYAFHGGNPLGRFSRPRLRTCCDGIVNQAECSWVEPHPNHIHARRHRQCRLAWGRVAFLEGRHGRVGPGNADNSHTSKLALKMPGKD